MSPFIDAAGLRAFDAASFRARRPFPWCGLGGFLTADGFAALQRDFPSVDRFERQQDRPKPQGPRPHDRYYLAYEASVYDRLGARARGTIRHRALPDVWQAFLAELQGESYRSFLRSLLGDDAWEVRYAWHLGHAGSEVSPHRDAGEKRATHILYFNTPQDWSREWGGETLVLGGPRAGPRKPDFGDFATAVAVPFVGNRSFLFLNGPEAWHGVPTIRPPDGCYRRLFNIIVSRRPGVWRRTSRRALTLMRRAV